MTHFRRVFANPFAFFFLLVFFALCFFAALEAFAKPSDGPQHALEARNPVHHWNDLVEIDS